MGSFLIGKKRKTAKKPKIVSNALSNVSGKIPVAIWERCTTSFNNATMAPTRSAPKPTMQHYFSFNFAKNHISYLRKRCPTM